ncbi:hypothetical protein HO133_003036 [Letharia lupina]|uniref:phosphatidylinositol-3,4,5-trisphosphate 3-phosphatase n=1 Tax=Letharia lupina TaxID=560253 RepID=A0A8H6CBQ2_9LECA|nr:uncharacterized protein HO133_003036 [Letharia lupina]KAF6220603.1 hypothetical protein HO133_003036 [Letharia lupina]
MASLLRSIVAGPRSRHPEAGLDLCYVTDNIIATSGPSSTYPQRAYRNPTDALVRFLDYKHGNKWAIWEFRAEGTGYPDSEVYNRIRHFPWPDHHPPPFALIPNIVASMREWLKGPESEEGRTIVVHCKAGKGRSGTSACSYLISEEGWTIEEALTRFTSRRMRSGFGSGVSIPSQLRWVGYVDWWTRHGKIYVERQIEILEVHVWGLRDGVKVAVAGYVEEGRVIKTFHTFDRKERMIMDGESQKMVNPASVSDHLNEKALPLQETNFQADPSHPSYSSSVYSKIAHQPGADAVLFRPERPIVLPTSDINVDFERRNKATYGLTMVTSVAHVWFNAFFESQHSSTSQPDYGTASMATADPPSADTLPDSGVFEIDWEAMDGIKGSARKGTRALDRLAVVWRAIPETKEGLTKIITEPSVGQPVPESKAADWKNANLKIAAESLGKDLGLRTESPSSTNVSKASSTTDLSNTALAAERSDSDSEAGVKVHGPEGEEHIPHPDQPAISVSEPAPMDRSHSDGVGGPPNVNLGIEKMRSPIPDPDMRSASTQDLPGIPGQLP